MESYSSFALVYDRYMDNIPYDQWTENIEYFFIKYNMPMEIVADLGCGTGQMCRRLKKKGYDMIGIDMSYDMLMEAMNDEDSEGILYLCQDMRDFELYGTVGAVISLCDSMNYLANKEELLKVCRLVNNYLDPRGLFVFDMKTIDYYKRLGTTTIAENRDEGSFIWENSFDEETNDNSYFLTIYEENEEGTYDRYEEEHLQHAFLVEEVKMAIIESGLEFIGVFDEKTLEAPTEESDRIYFIAREVTK